MNVLRVFWNFQGRSGIVLVLEAFCFLVNVKNVNEEVLKMYRVFHFRNDSFYPLRSRSGPAATESADDRRGSRRR